MKKDCRMLKIDEITSDVFVITPEQIKNISEKFGDAVAESMNLRPLSQTIRQIALETLTKILNDSKKMGE